MKKILFAAVLFAFAFTTSKAQNPAVVPAKKETPKSVQAAGAAVTTPMPAGHSAVTPATKPTPRIAPASVRRGKPVMYRNGTHGKKRVQPVKAKNVPVKPIAPGTDEKK
ncbi:MAG: hypothetical protein NTV09_12190 [Bacteroidetes bacterium]|nr:hypothetical protein [Bacteroidota bacterium]